MIYKELKYDDLHITLKEVYESMQYGDNVPDESVRTEIDAVIAEISTFLRPRFCVINVEGVLDTETNTLNIVGSDGLSNITFDIGKIIARQLKGSESYALFIATSGMEFQNYQDKLKREGDIVRMFIADSIGSLLAEKCADQMELVLEGNHTNRFSPGYCGWHVRQQQILFPLFQGNTCGVTLTSSSLMVPIKSVSGIIGIGDNVRKLEYTCGLCDFDKCYKKKFVKKFN